MYKIVICIPTYKRPVSLRKLILSISECSINKSIIDEINLLIIDNDTELSAKKNVEELHTKFIDFFKIHYSGFQVKGLSYIRNELLRNAMQLNPDFIVFIDDDEYVTKEWLNSLMGAILTSNADAVRGPVLAVAEKPYPDNIWCWFNRENYSDGSRIYSLTTGNLILRRSSLEKYNVWFDKRFNLTGFEDSYFGIQMLKKKATIYWASQAVTYETIPESKANIKWLMLRNYNGAITYTIMLKIEREFLKIAIKLFLSILYIVGGFITLPSILFPLRRKYWGLLKISEGIGGIAGLLNIKFYEYK